MIILYVKIARNMGKLLKASSVSLHLKNTKGQRVDYKAQRTRTVNICSNKKISADRTKDNIFLKRKMTERGSGWDDRLEAGYRN